MGFHRPSSSCIFISPFFFLGAFALGCTRIQMHASIVFEEPQVRRRLWARLLDCRCTLSRFAFSTCVTLFSNPYSSSRCMRVRSQCLNENRGDSDRSSSCTLCSSLVPHHTLWDAHHIHPPRTFHDQIHSLPSSPPLPQDPPIPNRHL